MAMKSYQCVFTVIHDGKTYKSGDTVQMEPEQAAELLARGTLIDGKKATAPNAGMPDPKIAKPKEPENAAQKLTDDPANAPA